MEQLTPILLIMLAAAAVFAFTQMRQVGLLRGELRLKEDAKEEKRLEAENARRDARERLEELTRVKKELQEAKAKQKKQESKDKEQERDKTASKTERPAKSRGAEPAGEKSAASVVLLSNQEIDEQHRRALAALEAQLTEARTEIEGLRASAAERKAAADRASAALEAAQRAAQQAAQSAQVAQAQAPVEQPAPVAPPRGAGEEVEALRAQLEAFQRAATERESDLRKQLSRLQGEVRSVEKRANNNHQLYQVAKGQLAVTEDKLAALKRKYEGARAPEQLRKPRPASEAAPEGAPAGDVAGAEAAPEAAPAAETAAPAAETAAPVAETAAAPAPEAPPAPASEIAAAQEPAPPKEDQGAQASGS